MRDELVVGAADLHLAQNRMVKFGPGLEPLAGDVFVEVLVDLALILVLLFLGLVVICCLEGGLDAGPARRWNGRIPARLRA